MKRFVGGHGRNLQKKTAITTIQFVRCKSAAAEFTVIAQSSRDMINWNTVPAQVEIIGSAGDFEFVQVTDTEPIIPGKIRNLRLKIEAVARTP